MDESWRSEVVSRYLTSLPNLVSEPIKCTVNLVHSDCAIERHASIDNVLTAFAQLGALRMRASRCLISLVDTSNQHIIAEATQTLSLQSDAVHAANDSLWLGACTIPRSEGCCGTVVDMNPSSRRKQATSTPLEASAAAFAVRGFVVGDMLQDERFCSISQVTNWPRHRFYAGFPIVDPNGIVIGAYCIFDSEPRSELPEGERQFLKDMCTTVMQYLTLCRLRSVHQQRDQMLRGLGSFIQGSSSFDLEEFAQNDVADNNMTDDIAATPKYQASETKASALPSSEGLPGNDTSQNDPLVTYQLDRRIIPAHEEPTASSIHHSSPLEKESSNHPPAPSGVLPHGHTGLFSRAAESIRPSAGFSGVAFFDASGSRGRNSTTDTGSEEDLPLQLHEAQALDSKSMDSETATNSSADTCDILGINTSTDHKSGVLEDTKVTLNRQVMRRILKVFPRGVFLRLNRSGSWSDMSDSSTEEALPTAQDARISSLRTETVTQITKACPTAKSITLFPLWNHERQRWSALAFCWISGSDKSSVVAHHDLRFLRIFGGCIMNDLSRLEALEQEHAKTTFINSISHEIRSPLNGILGGMEFLSDSAVDFFQDDMINSVQQCGRTLLDTLDHLLDHAKINSKRVPASSSSRKSPTGSPSLRSKKHDVVDVGLLTEEVVDAVFASHSFRHVGQNSSPDLHDFDDAMSPSSASSPRYSMNSEFVQREDLRVILDIPLTVSSKFIIQPGVWSRLVMNIFANAVKFTSTGFIKVKLRCRDNATTSQSTKVTLTISDTGRGISQKYLRSDLYTAFSQEDPFSAGTGLGLSLVRKMVRSLEGTIDIESVVSSGTEVKICLDLQRAKENQPAQTSLQRKEIMSVAETLQGIKVCVLDDTHVQEKAVFWLSDKFPMRPINWIGSMTRSWFGMDVLLAKSWEDMTGDIWICPEPTVQTLIRTEALNLEKSDKQIIFICLDAMEASVLRDDIRQRGLQDIAQVIIQPCGPMKLARAFKHCLKALKDPTPRISLPSAKGGFRPQIRRVPTDNNSASQLGGQDSKSPASIMIVDDNPINIKMLSAFLRKMSLAHKTAADGQEAVDAFKAVPVGTYKHILMDLSMPVLDGQGATRQIRAHEQESGSSKRCKIIALTGLANAGSRAEAMGAGMDHYLTKPLKFDALRKLMGIQ